MSKKIKVEFDPPIETLGALRVALDELVRAHPNPTDELRGVRLRVTVGGKVRAIEVSEPNIRDLPGPREWDDSDEVEARKGGAL